MTTVVVGLFCYFLFKWVFRVVALVTVGKLVGQAGAHLKKTLKGDKGENAQV
jgi:hypothetical protein